jgi:deazaflavin-dependent oxidoreductase (nitroreductase family)
MADKELLAALNSTVEIDLLVKGRKSGRNSSRPVWFVLEGETLYLLPVAGTQTQWYRNVLVNPDVTIRAQGRTLTSKAKPVREAAKIADVVERFRTKHGVENVKKYYAKLDAAVTVAMVVNS